jgi:hypothetical protein
LPVAPTDVVRVFVIPTAPVVTNEGSSAADVLAAGAAGSMLSAGTYVKAPLVLVALV